MNKLSIKNDIQANHYITVQLTKLGQAVPDNYNNNKYPSECIHDGVTKSWTLSQNMYSKITADFKVGDTFCVLKWKSGDKMGYNYLDPTDIQIKNATPMKSSAPNPEAQMQQAQEVFTPPPPTQEHVSQEKPDNIEERIIRGMCFNNASLLISKMEFHWEHTPINVKKMTEILYKEMSNWLKNGQ